MRQQLADLKYRLEFRIRHLLGANAVSAAGHRWSVRSANSIKSIRLLHRADPLKDRFLGDAGPEDVLLDVGANYGSWTIPAACRPDGPRRVYAIEPAPAPYLALLENLLLNGCQEKVTPLSLALGAQAAALPFRLDSLDPSSGTSHMTSDHEDAHIPTGALWKRRPVDTAILVLPADELLRLGAIEAPTLVKIDTEGYEAEVIRGLGKVSESVRRLFVEIHPDRLVGASNPEEVLALLRDLGFSIAHQSQRGRQLHVLCERT